MFLTILDLFLCQIMEYSPILCFADVIRKKKQVEKKQKKKKVENAVVFVAI